MTPAGEKIHKWSYGGSEGTLFVKKLRAKNFGTEEIATILDIIDSTCKFCWDSDDGCQCWNDE